jgi:peptide/nickel transport system substrate-binding protein
MFAFMAMLYWSSLLVEERLANMNNELGQLRNDILLLRNDSHSSPQQEQHKEQAVSSNSIEKQSQSDKDFKNILTVDPFYQSTLPKMLAADFHPHGTFRNDSVGRPDNLHPFSNWAQVAAWNAICVGSLANLHFGKYDEFAPDLALRIEERPYGDVEKGEFKVFLRKDAFWVPLKEDLFPNDIQLASHFLQRHPVTAHDFKFYWDAIMNPSVQDSGAVALRTLYSDINEIEIIDDYTFVVRWKSHPIKTSDGKTVNKVKFMARSLTLGLRPLPFFVYGYFADGSKIVTDDSAKDTYRYNSSWAQNFTEHWAKNIIVSCGPWQFEGMTDREIHFSRNNEYYNPLAALANNMVVEFKNSTEASWQNFESNQIDSYNILPNQLADLEDFLKSPRYQQQKDEGQTIERIEYTARTYIYIGWNQAKPYFTSKKVRQALTLAIDRKRIIQQNLNGLGIEISCPFLRASDAYDPSIEPMPFDLHLARQLLKEEGWYDSDRDGIIDKTIDGKNIPFRFTLTYFVKNNVTKEVCEYVATTLKEVGIDCRLKGIDIADLTEAFEDKSFEALCMGWALGTPPEDPRQLWHSSGAHEKGSSNAIGFANKEIDAIIDALDYEYDENERKNLYHRFDKIWFDEAPYTLLYSPKTLMLYRSYLQNVFIPAEKQDLIPGAVVEEPNSGIFWLKEP